VDHQEFPEERSQLDVLDVADRMGLPKSPTVDRPLQSVAVQLDALDGRHSVVIQALRQSDVPGADFRLAPAEKSTP